ncbi:MAG: hypothetical protein KGS45_11105 [Planctomycetes bacterium]|nr:hypothetical protein [Planctomycetota bacterium]
MIIRRRFSLDSIRSRQLATCVLVCASAAILTGCRPPVFGPNEDRSQFDRFDQARDSRAQTLIEDEFGRKVPNLRKRLVHTE